MFLKDLSTADVSAQVGIPTSRLTVLANEVDWLADDLKYLLLLRHYSQVPNTLTNKLLLNRKYQSTVSIIT